MGAFRPLFELRVEHEYFGDGGRALVDIEAGKGALECARQFGLLLRQTPAGMTVLADAERLDDLRAHVASNGGALRLQFHIYSQDPHFAEYSLPAPRPPQVLVLTSSQARADGERRLLHAGPFLGDDAYATCQAGELDAVYKPLSLRQPVAVVNIIVTDAGDGLCSQDCAPPARRFCLRFGAAHTYWKYLLFGDLQARQASVVDLDNAVVFRRVGDATFADAHSAAVFLSDRPIALRAAPPQCIQLKEQASFGEKILIRRMPNARVGMSQREIIDGQAVLVSEIFIH